MPVEFSKMLVAWREKHQDKNRANAPRFPLLAVWNRKYASGGVFEGPEVPKNVICMHFLNIGENAMLSVLVPFLEHW